MITVQWWEALLLALGPSLLTGAVAFGIAVLTHSLTTKAAREADTRTQVYAREAEERQARRDHRRERIRPVFEVLDLFRDYAGRSHIDDMQKKMGDTWEANKVQFATENGIGTDKADEVFKNAKAEWVGEEGGANAMLFRVFRGLFSVSQSCPTEEIRVGVIWAFSEAVMPGTAKDAFQNLEQALEDYIAHVN